MLYFGLNVFPVSLEEVNFYILSMWTSSHWTHRVQTRIVPKFLRR